MTQRIINIIRGYETIKDWYISDGALPDEYGCIAIQPDGYDKAERVYTDGKSIRGYGFTIRLILPHGFDLTPPGEFIKYIGFFLEGSDDDRIIEFKMTGAPTIEKRNSAKDIYSMNMKCYYEA